MSSDQSPLLPPVSPRQKRRLTFSGGVNPNYSLSASGNPLSSRSGQEAAQESNNYEVSDAFGQLRSCGSSVNNDNYNGNGNDHYNDNDYHSTSSLNSGINDLRQFQFNNNRSSSHSSKGGKGSKGTSRRHNSTERWISKQNYFNNSMRAGGMQSSPMVPTTSTMSSSARPSIRDPIKIDMTLFENLNHDSHEFKDGLSENQNLGDDSDFDSKPSSRRTSESSSLADVCFPIDQMNEHNVNNKWPDLSFLTEFQHDEMVKSEEESVNQDDLVRGNTLQNQKINEAEILKGSRLRPPKLNPWNTSADRKFSNYPPVIPNNPELYRFTYFRENLSSTIHSQTISGLLQPGQTFANLFDPQNDSFKDEIANEGSEANGGNSTPSAAGGESPEDHHITPFWLDVLNPTEEEMKVLSKTFAIHPLTTEDIFLGEVREKVELFKDYYFICFRSFDIVYEKAKTKFKRNLQNMTQTSQFNSSSNKSFFSKLFKRKNSSSNSNSNSNNNSNSKDGSSLLKKKLEDYKRKNKELQPLNVYILVFKHGVITFHFKPTPHPVNVRRRARVLREYLTVSADWIAYALIDDITDAFGPMIESIEDEVNAIEDSILRMSNDSSDDESDDEDDEAESLFTDKHSISSRSSAKSDSSNLIEWKRKGDMLKRIGESRKKVMSLLRLLGSKADVIKGFAKRCNEQWDVAPRSEIEIGRAHV